MCVCVCVWPWALCPIVRSITDQHLTATLALFRQRETARSYSDSMHRYYLHYDRGLVRANNWHIICAIWPRAYTRRNASTMHLSDARCAALAVWSLCKCAYGTSRLRIIALACFSDCPLPSNIWCAPVGRSDVQIRLFVKQYFARAVETLRFVYTCKQWVDEYPKAVQNMRLI